MDHNRNPLEVIDRYRHSIPVDVEGAIRSLGIDLDANALLPLGISGELRRLPSGQFKIKTPSTEHEFRRRFTMAHELGHYIFHRDLIGDGVNDNHMYRSAPGSDLYNNRIKQIHEAQANSFAANFLMPEQIVRKEVSLYGADVDILFPRFRVSPSAMRWRLQNLRYDPRG